MKHLIPILITILFIITAVSPMVIGLESDAFERDIMRDELLDNLVFYCYGPNGLNTEKYNILKEQLLKDYSNNGIDIEADEIQSVKSLPITISNGPMDSPWSMKCHDNHHTSRSQYSTADTTGLEKWRYKCDAGVDGSPIVGEDGTVYFGDKFWYINALHPNGTIKWRYETNGVITSTPALSDNGTLYIGSWDDSLYAFNSTNGARKWKVGLGATVGSSPVIGGDGTIYTATSDGRVWAVNPNGTKKWDYPTGGGNIWGDPAIGDDGTIYVGTWKEYFYAINPNGTLKWRYKTGDIIKGSASIADDGTIYIGSFDDYLYAYYPNNGTVKWKCKFTYGTETNPSIASDGTIYVGCDKLYAIYPTGTLKWSFSLDSGRHIAQSSPAISADGTIYVGTNIGEVSGGDIIAVNPDGSEKWHKKISSEGWVDSSPCIAEDGTVYIGSTTIHGGYLHAFGPVESNNPPEISSISGETNGEAGENYWYTFVAVDPDNNPISWYIDWGDGTINEWKSEWASGENCYYEHTWTKKGNYTIKAKAIDTLGEESDWAYLEVTMPKNKSYNFNLTPLDWLFERFPNAFPIMRQLLRF